MVGLQLNLLILVTGINFKMDTNIVVKQKITFELRLSLETITMIDTGSHKDWKVIMI